MSVDMRVSYPDGKPDGVVSIEKDGASGHAIAFPQQLCAEVCQDSRHKILQWPCVYVLWAPGAHNQKPGVYVGESDSFAKRITLHQSRKEFWTRAVVYSDEKGYLGKTHALQIEGWLVDAAKEAQLCDLQNKQNPHQRAQNEVEAATSRRHFDDLRRFFLPLAGCDFFRPHSNAIPAQIEQPTTPATKAASVAVVAAAPQSDDLLFLRARQKGIEARGRETDMGFVVYAGSQVAKYESRSLRENDHLKHNVAIREGLVAKNLLVDDGGVYRLLQDYTFKSPSTAATVILGANVNGLEKWENAEGLTLKQLQNKPQNAFAAPKPTADNCPIPRAVATLATSASADLFLDAGKIKARGRKNTEDKFLVYAGSQAAKCEVPSLRNFPRYGIMRANLQKENVLTDDGDAYRFTRNYIFNSPSEAANVILGKTSNGRKQWKDAEGRTINELEGQKK